MDENYNVQSPQEFYPQGSHNGKALTHTHTEIYTLSVWTKKKKQEQCIITSKSQFTEKK